MRTFSKVSVAYVYMIWRSFLLTNVNGQMLMKWLSEQFGDDVRVFMSSLLCWKHRDLHTRLSSCMCAVNETAASVSFINRDAEHAVFIF